MTIADSCDYPTPGALAYRDAFCQGANANGLSAIPDAILSWAIDRALQAGALAWPAGKRFADVYFAVQQKRDYQDMQRRNGIVNREQELMGCYEHELSVK